MESSGKTTTSAKKLNELCRLIPDGEEINLSLNGDKLNIKTTHGKYSLSTLPSADFPVFDIDSGDSPLIIPAKDLRELIRNTSFAMGNQDWRHYLAKARTTQNNVVIIKPSEILRGKFC